MNESRDMRTIKDIHALLAHPYRYFLLTNPFLTSTAPLYFICISCRCHMSMTSDLSCTF